MLSSTDYHFQKSSINKLSKAKVFGDKLRQTLEALSGFDKVLKTVKPSPPPISQYRLLRRRLSGIVDRLASPEIALFDDLFYLYAIKAGIGEKNSKLRRRLFQSPYPGLFVGFLGPLGIGKSTVAQDLMAALAAAVVTREPYENNPFLAISQRSPDYMLRSQTYFLLTNIKSDMVTRLASGIAISDTSTLTDILMWCRWYSQTGHFAKEDYRIYQRLVNLLCPIIPRPDYLVVLSLENVGQIPLLKQGIAARLRGQAARDGEKVFVASANRDLARQNAIVDLLARQIPRQWGVRCLHYRINPLRVYQDQAYRAGLVTDIKNAVISGKKL